MYRYTNDLWSEFLVRFSTFIYYVHILNLQHCPARATASRGAQARERGGNAAVKAEGRERSRAAAERAPGVSQLSLATATKSVDSQIAGFRSP